MESEPVLMNVDEAQNLSDKHLYSFHPGPNKYGIDKWDDYRLDRKVEILRPYPFSGRIELYYRGPKVEEKTIVLDGRTYKLVPV